MLVTNGMPRGYLAALLIISVLMGGSGVYSLITGDNAATALSSSMLILFIIFLGCWPPSAKAPAKMVELPDRRVAVESPLAPDAVFAKLAALKFGKVALHDADAGRGVVVLSSPMANMHFGHFYPIFVRGSGRGSIVEVGITPTSLHTERSLQNALEMCAAEIKKALAA